MRVLKRNVTKINLRIVRLDFTVAHNDEENYDLESLNISYSLNTYIYIIYIIIYILYIYINI